MMTFQRAFRLIAILLALIGFTALVATGKVRGVLTVLGTGALVLSFLHVFGWGLDWRVLRLSSTAWNVIMVAGLIISAADFVWGSQEVLPASSFVLTLLMINKVLTLQYAKDFLYLYVISFLQLLAAAVLTIELWYAAVFVAYLLTATWALLLWHMHHESESVAMSDRSGQTRVSLPLTMRFFWVTNTIAVGALALTLSIFFIMPRTGFGFFQQAERAPVRTAGFSENVDLGVIGAVKQDPSLVMRVEFPDISGAPGERVYFRGVAYDRYNGRSWTNTFARRRILMRNEEGLFEVSNRRLAGKRTEGLRQQILIEALDTSVLFGMPFVDEIRGNFLAVQADGMGALSLPYPLSSRFQYMATSARKILSGDERRSTVFTYPEDITTHFLQVPKMDADIIDLVQRVTRHAQTPYERVIAVERHLLANYQYTLDVEMDDGASPLEDFLLRRKTGYCEHYATAMVVMLRTVGIPARLTTGFLSGEWNDFGGYFRVRQQDAHAWVEVFFPRSGWVTFDPTPTVGMGAPDPMWRHMASLVDSIRLKWDRFVIHYSFRDQMAVTQRIREEGEKLRTMSVDLVRTIQGWMAVGKKRITGSSGAVEWRLAVAVIVCMIIIGSVAMQTRRHRSRLRLKRRRPAVAQIYQRMLRILASQGVKKSAGCTPCEFSDQVKDEWTEAELYVQPLTELYCRVRFGQQAFPESEVHTAEELLHCLQEMKRPGPQPVTPHLADSSRKHAADSPRDRSSV